MYSIEAANPEEALRFLMSHRGGREVGAVSKGRVGIHCRAQFEHSLSILFTGETDFPAQALYESMGYQRIGEYGLVFGAKS